ncbi:MAG: hypothetical protein KDI92_11425 [Xanthomonadales bacterium]|nr:hypothetical protein [Xanthomonadales bacterium]
MKYMVLWLLLMVQLSSAQSLLQNGTFDQSLDHWDNPSITPIWVSNDGAPASGNGSLRFGSTFNNGGSVWMQSDIMPVKEGYRYIMASSYKLPSDSIANGLWMSIYWYDEMDNYLGEYPWDQRFNIGQTDTWLDFDYTFENIITDATKARVVLWVTTPASGSDESYGLFDDVIFFQDTVFVTGFE